MTARFTSVPDVIDALLASFTVSLEGFDPNVPVFDGYPPGGDQPDDFVIIGGTSATTAEGESHPAGMPVGVRVEEDYVVRALVASYRGDADTGDQKTVRDRAFSILDVILGGLYLDVTLGGVCDWCIFDRLAFRDTDVNTATQGRDGSIEFTLHVTAHRNILPTS